MSIYTQTKSLTTSAILLVCASALAETPEALVKQALQRNPELNFSIAEIAAAKGAVRTAGTIRNPELSSELGYKNSRESAGGVSGDGAILALSLSQTFEYPGRIALRKAIANHDLVLAELHLQQFRLTLASRVRSLAYASISIHERMKAVQEVASRTQALNDVLKQRPLAGVAPQLEAQIISATLLTFQRQERESTLAEKTIAEELNQLCGRPPGAALTVSADPIVFTAASVRKLLNAARSNAFDIRIRQAELAQQGFKVALSKNERFPAIAVGPFYSLENAIDREHRVGLGFSLPLPLWDRNVGNIASSKARQQQAEASLALTEREVERRVTQTAAALDAKRAEIETWKNGAMAKLRETTELADQNYRLGAVPLTTYVEIQKQYLEAISAFNEAQKDALEAAQTLEILTGQKLYREEQGTMIDKILEFSVRQRVLVLMGGAALLLGGLWSANKLPMDAIPDITGVQVQVNTNVPALAPDEVEKLVTAPLEMALGGVAGVTEMRSLSRFGLSQITLQFSDKTDIYRARQLVTERLQSAAGSLPAGLTPTLIPITTGLGEVFYYTVDYAPDAPNPPITREAQLMELWQIQEYLIKPQLRTVPGVAEVNAYGGYVKQIVVQPNIAKLRDAGLTVNDLAKVVGENVENAGGGIVNAGTEQLVIRGVGRVVSPREIAELPVKFAAAVMPLRVKDFADVQIGHAFRTGAATHSGEEAVLGVAMMLMGENSHAVAERVAEKISEIQKRVPAGVVINQEYNRKNLVHRTIRTVTANLFEGALLVTAVLLLLLGNWRAALIVATAIPLSFLFAITGMTRFGISGNLMSLGAIDFGLIIDGAVVIVENVVRQLGAKQRELERRLTTDERLHVVLAASKQVGTPMFFGVSIIAIVYLPILALSGIEGKMFHPMALTVMLALGGSLVLALTLMPALCSFLLRGRIAERDNLVIRFCKRVYAPVLHVALRLRWLVVLGAVALFALAILIFNRLGADFIPKLDEGAFTMMVYRAASISVDATVEAQRKTDREIKARVPEVTHVFSRIGSAEIATDPMPPSDCDFYIFYKPRSEWRKIDNRRITKEELAKIITTEIETLNPGAHVMIAQPVEMRFNEMLEGIRADIAVKIFGNDYDVLERLGSKVKDVLEQIRGTREGEGEVEYETTGRAPMLEIRVKRDVLAKYNLHAGDVNQAISAALAGQTVGTMVEGSRRFDIVVRLAERDRENVEAIRTLPVRVGDAGMLPLGALADIERVKTVSPILRDSAQRRAALMVNLRGRDVESWVREAETKVREQVRLPEGYTIEFGGQFENLREAKARLAIVVPAALAFIFVLIFMAFGSVRQTLLVYTGVPLAITGGVVALWLRGMPFSISAAVGFIALSGVAVLNGVVMISYFNQLREQGRDVRSAVIEGSLTRLRPVLMTAAVAAFGFIPMALSTSAGAEVQRPLATVVIGGIISSTFLTLVLLPVLYEWVERKRRRVSGERVNVTAVAGSPAT